MYMDAEYFSALYEAGEKDAYFDEEYTIPVLDQVWVDDWESYEIMEQEYEEDSHPLEDFSDTAVEIAETGWETQGDIIGENSYEGIVLLTLQYYEGKLY